MNLNPIVFALRHPFTIMVRILALVLGSALALSRMKIDIFPSLNLPVIYVAQPYGGLDPAQMEGLITNYYEYHFLYISGIEHVESRNVQGNALMKLYFHPGTDMAQAMAETVQYVNRSRAFMPPGTVGPFVMRFDTGSVPVGYLVLSSKTRSIGEIQNLALFNVRPMFSSLPGVSAPPPFGGNQRTIVVQVDPERLRAYHASPDDVVTALTAGNTISPSGNARIQDQMPIVPVNAMVKDPRELGNIPLRPGESVFLRDLARIEDSTDIPTGYALVDGRRAVYLLVNKRADASTLSVIQAVRANLDAMRKSIPDDIEVHLEFDQSPFVTRSMWGVGTEGLLGACLTGLMVLLFLRDWRSVIVVVLNIPFALLGSLIALWLTGQTLNLMTLGGLALAVGILVDESTVEVENIHTQMEHCSNIARATRLGNAETAVPRLLAMLCVLTVFIPAFFMQGAAQALFVPLALAVGFAMLSSYLLSSTFVPVLSVWVLRHDHPGTHETAPRFSFMSFRAVFARLLRAAMPLRWLVVALYLIGAGLFIWQVGGRLGTEIFPTVDTGQFQLRLRAPDGTRIERTEELANEALAIMKDAAGKDREGKDNLALSVGYLGLIPSSYPINTIYLWTRGPEEAVLRLALKEGSGVRVETLKQQLRLELPRRLGDWYGRKLRLEGLNGEQVAERLRGMKLSFEPADIINEVMSFGSPTPIEVAVSGLAFTGPKAAEHRAYVDKIYAEMARIPALQDLQFAQSLEYPAVAVEVDRQRAGLSGVTTNEVARSLVSATSSSRFVVPNYWAAPDTGIGYQVQVEIPPFRMNSADEIGLVPIKGNGTQQLLLRDVAQVHPQKVLGEYDRYNMKRLLSVTANIEGEDLGRVATQLSQALAAAGAPPGNLKVDIRGQIVPMRQMFGGLAGGKWTEGLTLGLGLAVAAIFLLLTAYFQSVRLALISVSAVPAVVAGVALMLCLTRTTLNIQSFMGAIMGIGVAVANAILLVTFAERHRRNGASAREAAVEGAQGRLWPILMTACAMIAGMVPMALGLGEGGEQTAPLGQAVIGGLVAATLTTLVVLPAVFAVVQGRSSTASASLDPDDPESSYADQAGSGASAPTAPPANGPQLAGRMLTLLVVSGGLVIGSSGCTRPPASAPAVAAAPAAERAALAIVHPERTTIHRSVSQPGYIQAFEQTPIYSKIAGYVDKVNVDKGDVVARGNVLAVLSVPEMEVEVAQKSALIGQAEAELKQAQELVAVAEADVKSAAAKVQAVEATRLRSEAQVERTQSQLRRFAKAGREGAIGGEDVEEIRLAARAAEAGLAEVRSQIRSAQADRDASQAKWTKSKADVLVADARLQVARKNLDQARTMLAYKNLTAPFDHAVVTSRNVDTGHFVQPATGPNSQALFVVMRTDVMRIRLEVPEADAFWIDTATTAQVHIPVLKTYQFTGKVARTSWSLDRVQRTLLAEVDVPNPVGKLRPNMYVEATLVAEWPNVLTLPASAIVTEGDVNQGFRTFCYLVSAGKARRTPLQIGARDAQRVEVLKKRVPPIAPGAPEAWERFTGQEEALQAVPSDLRDGQEIKAASSSSSKQAWTPRPPRRSASASLS
jgi:RND family efflux transporter MFP subunit